LLLWSGALRVCVNIGSSVMARPCCRVHLPSSQLVEEHTPGAQRAPLGLVLPHCVTYGRLSHIIDSPLTPGQHMDAPGGDPSKLAHDVQAPSRADPFSGLNVFAGHGMQASDALEAPLTGLYRPEGQGTGTPTMQTDPSGHRTSSEVLRGRHSMPSLHCPLHRDASMPSTAP
jgi:hypothetical protein